MYHDSTVDTVDQLAILGRVSATKGGAPVSINGRRSLAVLITISLSDGIGVQEIAEHLRGARQPALAITGEAIHQQVRRLRRLDFPIGTRERGKCAEYFLDGAHCRLDVDDFIAGVERLPREPEPTVIGRLLALWRGDPRREYPEVDVRQWHRAFTARDSLMAMLKELPPGQRSQVPNLPAFAALFPSDPELAAIRPTTPAVARNRLLIVENDIGDQLVQILDEEGYECVLIPSWEAWKALKAGGLNGYDGALVDLHLLGRDDAMGLHIIEYLRDYTAIPCAAVTTNPLHTRTFERQKVMDQYRLVDLVDKRDGYLRELPATARLLVGMDDEGRRHRMRTWVRAAEFQMRREAEEDRNSSVARSKLEKCLKAVGEAENAIRSGSISEAQRLTDAVCKQFAPPLR